MVKKALGSSTPWKKRRGLPEPVANLFQGRRDDVLILFTGPTGVGKSTFIKEYTNNQEVKVGTGLKSCTQEVAWYEATMPPQHRELQGRRLILVDTPGFDDPDSNDSRTIGRISTWLAQVYNDFVPIAGLVYLNNITQNYMLDSTKINLQMLVKRCGNNALENVVLGTTQWDNLVDQRVGELREEELRERFWQEFVKGGAHVMRIRQKPEDLNRIVDHLVKNYARRTKENQILQFQRDVLDLEEIILTTGAGSSAHWRNRVDFLESMDKICQEHPDDVLILVFGPTVAGKSTFIQQYIERQEVGVGNGLKSCTQKVTWHEARMPPQHPELKGHQLLLVDTPGFNEPSSTDDEILRRISALLAQVYNDSLPIACLVYLNNITQNRMLGSTKTNPQMLIKRYGHSAHENVVPGTTQWDNLEKPRIGKEREEELKERFWLEVIGGGANVFEIGEKPQDLNRVVDHLLKKFVQKVKEDQILQIQREVVDLETITPDTDAEQEPKYTIQEVLMLQKNEDTLRADLDEDARRQLKHKQELLKNQFRALKVPFSVRFKTFFGLR